MFPLIRVLQFHEFTNSMQRRQLLKDLSVLLSVKHPNILPLLGLFRLQEDVCLVTQWAAGGSLMEYLRRTEGADRRAIVRLSLIRVHRALD